jgi:invasion protein IalB
MKRHNRFSPTPVMRSAALAVSTVAALALYGVTVVNAQQPAPPAKPKKPPAAAPAPAPEQPAPPAAGQPQQSQVQLVYSPWTKICGKDQQQANAKEVCLVIKEARLETGQFVAGAVLVEPEGEPRKILRVTLPLGMLLQQGTRVIIDQGTPAQRPYVVCFPNGCMSDYDADADMVSKLKKGQGLIIQAFNAGGQPISLQLPLADFAKAYDGPPTDPKVLEEQQKKLQEELQKKAEEARKKLEGQQSQSGQPPPATK